MDEKRIQESQTKIGCAVLNEKNKHKRCYFLG